jgi:hypothetical protein
MPQKNWVLQFLKECTLNPFFALYFYLQSFLATAAASSSFLKRVSVPLGPTDEIRCRDFNSNKNSSGISLLQPDYFTHSPRISGGIYLVVGELFCSCQYQSVFCDTKQRVTTLASSRSTLNLCPPIFCFSAGRRYQSPGEELAKYNHKECVRVVTRLCHVNLFSDETYYI